MTNDHLNAPGYREPPEWYYRLWVYLEEEQPPESIAVAIRQAMQMWVDVMNEEYAHDAAREKTGNQDPTPRPLPPAPHALAPVSPSIP